MKFSFDFSAEIDSYVSNGNISIGFCCLGSDTQIHPLASGAIKEAGAEPGLQVFTMKFYNSYNIGYNLIGEPFIINPGDVIEHQLAFIL